MRALDMARLGVFALLAAAGLALLFAVGLRFDPFGLTERRLERARAQAEQAHSEATARALERDAERDLTPSIVIVERAVSNARADLHHSIQQAREAPDAQDPLDGDRAARLHAHDRGLCDRAASGLACAAAPDPAGAG